MAPTTTKSSDTNGITQIRDKIAEMGETAYKNLDQSIQSAKKQVVEMEQDVEKFDKKVTEGAKAKAEKASDWLRESLQKARENLEKLAEYVKDAYDENKELPMKGFSKTIVALKKSLDDVKQKAKSYDDKYKVTQSVSDVITPARERALGFLAEISTYVTELTSMAYAQLQGINSAVQTSVKSYGKSGMNFMLKHLANLDTRFELQEKIQSLDEKYKVSEKLTETAKKVDEKFHVQENAEKLLETVKEKGKNLDEKYTEGKYVPMIEEAYKKGVKMVSEGLQTVKSEFDIARKSSRENLAGMNDDRQD